MPEYTCYDLAGEPTPCSSQQMGEQYWEAVQSGDPNDLYIWYNTHLSGFLENIETEGFDPTDPSDFNQWMGTYGQYFAPLAFDEADYNRINRESRLQKEALRLSFFEDQPTAELQEGRRGFSGTGGTGATAPSAWEQYRSGHQDILSSTGMQLQDLYGQFGSNFLMTSTAIAGMDAYGDPDLGEDEYPGFSYEGAEGDMEFYDFTECLESCYEELGNNTQCAQACLD